VSAGWAKGSTRAWRILRRAILARDGHRCQLTIPGVCVHRSEPMHVHHKHGKDRCRGCKIDAPDHLQAACAPCNLHVGDPGKKGDPPCIPITRWT
jgi:5-methylcytosine-specific restriction endonuclease McrA